MIIIAVDPGLFSGYALWDSSKPQRIFTEELAYNQLWRRVRADLDEYDGHATDVHIVVERYTMTPGVKSAQPEALKIMGQLELLADMYGRQLHYYLPTTTKSMIQNKRLKQVGWYRPTPDGHANDGARVVGVHLAVRHPEIFGDLFGI